MRRLTLQRRHEISAIRLLMALLAATAIGLSGCGGSGGGIAAPHVGAARVFELAGFRPVGEIAPGRRTTIMFTVRQPSGEPLTSYKTGPGPHTGVHLIIVRDDLALWPSRLKRKCCFHVCYIGF